MDIKRNVTSCPLMVISPAFSNNDRIPVIYTDDGENRSPPLIWTGAPQGVQSYAIMCEDPALAPDETFTQWVIFDIPGSYDHVDEGIRQMSYLDNGARQGKNSMGDNGYVGPSPPIGKIHHYMFTVSALDTLLNLRAGITKDELAKAMEGHVLAEGSITVTYRRG